MADTLAVLHWEARVDDDMEFRFGQQSYHKEKPYSKGDDDDIRISEP